MGLAQAKATTIDPDVEDAEVIAESTVETLRHDGNPVMTWCAGNAVVTADPANNRKVDKAKAIGRIDGIVGAVMSVGISNSVSASDSGKSIYDQGVGI